MKNIFAKSDGTTLKAHSIEVAKKAKELAEMLTNDKEIIASTVIAALFHDIGKCTKGFQEHLLNNTYQDYIPHNILSASIVHTHLNIKCDESKNLINNIIRSILYHHPTNFKKIGINTIDNWDYTDAISSIDSIMINSFIDEMIEIYDSYDFSLELHKKLTTSKHDITDSYFVDGNYKDVTFFIISNVVKFADFLASSGNNYFDFINGKYPSNINFIKPNNYDDRFDIQMDYADKSSNHRLALFEAQTGFGKTMLGIKYLLNNGKKGYWVCPRNTIAEGLYRTITKELKALGLSDTVSVALLLTNKWIHGNRECDIIITNIDNFVRPTTRTDSNVYSFNMLYCNCIFDEFHEYVDDQALMALFNVVLKSRFKCNNSKTLLLSATPIMNFVKEMKNDENFMYYRYDYEPLMTKKIQIKFSDKLNKDFLMQQNWLILVNTVNRAQDIYTNGYVDNIIHARFTESDLIERLETLYKEHGKNCGIPTTWVATNILSTGIDASFNNILMSQPTPERSIQAGGRCDRWGECSTIPIWCFVNDDTDFVEKRGIDVFTDRIFASKFYDFLTATFKDGEVITMRDMYNARISFYDKENEYYNKLFKETLKNSIKNLRKLTYEYSSKNNDETVKYISKKPSLRNNGDTISFFFKVKDDVTGNFIDEIMQGDNRVLDETILKKEKSIDYIFESIKNAGVTPYFKNIKQMENLYENRTLFWDVVYNKAVCSETPLLIGNNYYYNKKIGLYKKNNKKFGNI